MTRWIIEMFRGPFLGANGLPVAVVGQDRGDLLPELGDWAPLLAAAGDPEWAFQQSETVAGILNDEPLLRGLRTRFPRPGPFPRVLRALGAAHLQDYSEILLGFLELHQVTSDPRPLEHGLRLAHHVFEAFGSGLRSFRVGGATLLCESVVGNVIEASLDLAAESGDDALKASALNALEPWLANPVLASVSLWPSWSFPAPDSPPRPFGPFRRVDLAKSNTSMASAVLRAHQATGESRYRLALDQWRDGLEQLRHPEGGLLTLAQLQNGRLAPMGRPNSSNHAAVEVLLDAHREFGDATWLDRALELADYWRRQVHPETGLLPDIAGGSESFVDSNTDFAVLFRKIGDLTKAEEWHRAADALVEGVRRWHRTPDGLANRTDLATGRVVDSTVETRYTSLHLKALLPPAGVDVWNEPLLLSLLRDR